MKNIILFIIIFLPAQAVIAQQFKWLKTIGGMRGGAVSGQALTEKEHVNNLCTDAHKNLYAASFVGDSTLRADTFYQNQSHGNNIPYTASLLLTSYTCDGTMRWARLLEGEGDVLCYGLQYHAGSIYVAGRFGDAGAHPNRFLAGVPITGHDSQHYFLARFDTLGALRWLRFVGANDNSSAISISINSWGTDDHSLAIDGQGNIHHFTYLNKGVKITPAITALTGTYDLKYDTTGKLLGAVRLGVDSNYFLYDHRGNDFVYKNSVSISKKSGKIFTVMTKAVFNMQHVWQSSNYRLCAFAPGGALLWQDTLAGNTTFYPQTRIRDACYDGGNGIYLSGEGKFGQFKFNGALPNYTPIVGNAPLTAILKVDTNGTPIWIYANEHYADLFGLGNTTLLPDGNILSAGSCSGAASHGNDSIAQPNYKLHPKYYNGPFYTIVTPQGSLVKMDEVFTYYKTPTDLSSSFTAVAVDQVGNMYLGGSQGHDTIKFPGGLYHTKYPYTYNEYDGFIAKLGVNCRCTPIVPTGFKDSVRESTVYFTYTGTTEAVDSIVWTYGHGLKKKVITGFTTPFSHTYASYSAYARDTICVTVYSACGNEKYCKYPPALSVVGVKGMEGVVVYPNPAQAGRFTVSFESGHTIQTASITVTNITGQVVYIRQYQPLSSSFVKEVDLSSAAKGIYFVELVADGARLVSRIVVN